MNNKSISVKKNFIYNSAFQVLVLIVPFVTTPYVSRILGADNIGKYSYASAMVTYFTLLAALGSTIYGQRKIAYYRDDKETMSRAFWNIFISGSTGSPESDSSILFWINESSSILLIRAP